MSLILPKWLPGNRKPRQRILDSCCGSRMFWTRRDHPDVLYMDNRHEEHTLCDGRTLEVRPDVVADFRDMPFPDESFCLVVFDPPHLVKVGANAWLAKKYGRLDKATWRDDLRRGFNECLRVLKPEGALIVKWNTQDIPAADLWEALGQQPLFGSVCGKSGKTLWGVYVKGVEA